MIPTGLPDRAEHHPGAPATVRPGCLGAGRRDEHGQRRLGGGPGRPAGNPGVFVGLAVAAYTLPSAVGALALNRLLRHQPARVLVLAGSWLRAGRLAAIALLWTTGSLAPFTYLGLLAGSSVLSAWGTAGRYTLLSQLSGPQGRLAANSLYSAQASLRVIITVNGHSWKSRIAIMRGRYLLGLSNANRQAAGVVTGDEVEVEVDVDAEPPVVAEPADFARALDADPAARAAYDRLAYSHKRQHVRAIESAKKPETRMQRIEKTLAMLRDPESAGNRTRAQARSTTPGPGEPETARSL